MHVFKGLKDLKKFSRVTSESKTNSRRPEVPGDDQNKSPHLHKCRLRDKRQHRKHVNKPKEFFTPLYVWVRWRKELPVGRGDPQSSTVTACLCSGALHQFYIKKKDQRSILAWKAPPAIRKLKIKRQWIFYWPVIQSTKQSRSRNHLKDECECLTVLLSDKNTEELWTDLKKAGHQHWK